VGVETEMLLGVGQTNNVFEILKMFHNFLVIIHVLTNIFNNPAIGGMN